MSDHPSSKPRGIPLSLGEARGVAQQIRDSHGRYADVQYWPWVIEELVKMVEQARHQTPAEEDE